MRRNIKAVIAGVRFAALLVLAPLPAHAYNPGDACSNADVFPQVSLGDGRILVCDGANWKSVMDITNNGQSSVQVENDSANPCNTDKLGRLSYDDGQDKWQYCDGSNWKDMPSILKVYKGDGTTLVGYYLGQANGAPGCDNIMYSDPGTGAQNELTAVDCNLETVNVWFTGSNCSSTKKIEYYGGITTAATGWGCTGSGACTTGAVSPTGSASNVSVNSYRTTAGTCVNSSGVKTVFNTVSSTARTCGTGPLECVIKP